MIEFIKFVFGFKLKERGTGSIQADPDYRDITLASIQEPKIAPKSFLNSEFYVKRLPVLNQGPTSACTAHSRAMVIMFYLFRKSGAITVFSPRYVYKICKLFDGLPSHIRGTFTRLASTVAVKYGFPTEERLPNDISGGEEGYTNIFLEDRVIKNAKENRLPGFSLVYSTLQGITDAISQNGCVTASIRYGNWERLPVSGSSKDYHDIFIYAYEYDEKLEDYKFYFKNSWGSDWLAKLRNWANGGYGYFLWNDHKDTIRDINAYTDIPLDMLSKVKVLPFRFTKTLKLGDDDIQVRELQKMLNEDPQTAVAIEGLGSIGNETTFFGPATKRATIMWQKKQGLPMTGYFGPLSVEKANARIGNMNKIKQWALAIQEHEGYFKPGERGFPNGSRSYRNNNPGNIRYMGIFRNMALRDDGSNFCVFETYEKGLEALETLLIRACTGLSTVYSPEHTLLEFYERYAPRSDNNDPKNYAMVVANRLNVPVTTKIKDLL